MNLCKRNDGKGFFLAEVSTDQLEANYLISGVFQAAGSLTEDTGNYGIMLPTAPTTAAFAPSSAPNGYSASRILMRAITGTKRYGGAKYITSAYDVYSLQFSGVDQFEYHLNSGALKYYVTPIVLASDSPSWHFRGSISDLYFAPNNFFTGAVGDGGKYVAFSRLMIPWDTEAAGNFQPW
jgi:hypothetical protein